MLRIAICDDDQYICSEIERIILEYRKQISEELTIDVFSSGEELCRVLSEEEMFDLIFLDIEMKQVNGVEVGRFIREKLRNEILQIIYVSGKDSYYQQLFDVRPMHFIHKPIDAEKVRKDIDKAIELFGKLGNTFCFMQNNSFYRKPIKDIIYFEAHGRQVKLVGVDEEYAFYGRIKEIPQKLPKSQFLFIHKSFFINYHHVKRFNNQEVTMSNDKILPISRTNKDEVLNFLLESEKEEN